MTKETSNTDDVRGDAAAFPAGDVLDVRPEVREPGRYGIAIIGSGWIVEESHIPSYQTAGFRIEGITSQHPENAARVASRRGLKNTYNSTEELLADPAVDVVDIAVPPDVQPALIHAALDAGKHVLAQKPLAVTYAEAADVVAAAERQGRYLAVNQNGRFDPAVNATRSLVRSGALGERLVASISMCVQMPWQQYLREPRYDKLMLLNMSVHHIDQLRWIFGTPESVTAVTRTTGTEFPGETIAQYILRYADGFWASSLDDGTNWSDDSGISFRVQGSELSLRGEIGWLPGVPSRLTGQRRGDSTWHDFAFSRHWFPDAFSSTMGELLSALEDKRAPFNCGQDNMATMRTVFAAYQSAREGRTVNLAEVAEQVA